MTTTDPLERRLLELREAFPESLAAGSGPVAVARAPGRLDVLGGSARFAGTTWISWPMARGITVTLRSVPGRDFTLESGDRAARGQDDRVTVPFDGLINMDERTRAEHLGRDARRAWTARIVNALFAAFRRAGRDAAGMAVDVRSDLPEGSGFQSSTALVAATSRAAAALFGVDGDAWIDDVLAVERASDPSADPTDVRAICGAKAGRFLPFLAQPCEEFDEVQPPAGVEPVAFDLGGRLESAGNLRTAAAMAYRIMAARMGLTVRTHERGEPQEVEDPFYGGWLGNCDPVTFTNEFRDALPERQRGELFLDAYGGLADPVVRVDPGVEYAIREAAGYVLGENQRACLFVDALHRAPAGESSAETVLGALLSQSDHEARRIGSVPRDVTALLDVLERRGADRGVLGARSSGRGAVVALVRSDDAVARALQEAVAEWERSCGHAAHVLRGTSAGAADPRAARTFTP